VPQRNMIAMMFGAGLLAAGCSGSPVDTVDSDLASHFLAPLESAGVSYTIENTCHLQRDADTDPWHLEVRVRIDGDRDRVARLLEAQDVVVATDRDPMIIQQERGDPANGWNGVLDAGDGGSALALTYNNVVLDSVGEAGGWAEVCRLADLE
jgi:hypothetical protein